MKLTMKTKFIMAGIIACISMSTYAQNVGSEEPKGRAIVQVMGNFHTGFGAENGDRGFELERSYIGYEYNLGKGLLIKGVMDVGKSSSVDDYHRIAYIKNALISWRTGNLTLNGGLISTNQFNFQEKFWGYRYVLKSFQDLYKFGSSADLGISAAYKFAPWISADAIIVNGEGYKKIQSKDGLNYGLGVTLTPTSGFQIRLYGGVNESRTEGMKDIINIAAFAGYKNDRLTIGAEYNHMMNASYNDGNDLYGYSLFGSMKVAKFCNVFARFDDLYSNKEWNMDNDERVAVVGAQFMPCKYVKLAPNFRVNMPKADGVKEKYAVYLNCYFGI